MNKTNTKKTASAKTANLARNASSANDVEEAAVAKINSLMVDRPEVKRG
jgi:hypothetical protein